MTVGGVKSHAPPPIEVQDGRYELVHGARSEEVSERDEAPRAKLRYRRLHEFLVIAARVPPRCIDGVFFDVDDRHRSPII